MDGDNKVSLLGGIGGGGGEGAAGGEGVAGVPVVTAVTAPLVPRDAKVPQEQTPALAKEPLGSMSGGADLSGDRGVLSGQKPAGSPLIWPTSTKPAPAPGSPFGLETVVVHKVEVEAVVGGALQRITLFGCPPELVVEYLKWRDPNAKVRDDFPSKKSWGSRETKTASVKTITGRVTGSGKFIDLISDAGDTDIMVSVPKKLSGEFLTLVSSLQRLGDRSLARLTAGLEKEGSFVVSLGEGEGFGVAYWTAEDGKHIADSFVSEGPPAAEEKTEPAPTAS